MNKEKKSEETERKKKTEGKIDEEMERKGEREENEKEGEKLGKWERRKGGKGERRRVKEKEKEKKKGKTGREEKIERKERKEEKQREGTKERGKEDEEEKEENRGSDGTNGGVFNVDLGGGNVGRIHVDCECLVTDTVSIVASVVGCSSKSGSIGSEDRSRHCGTIFLAPWGGPERVEGIRIIDKVADCVIEAETEGLISKGRIGNVPLPSQGLEATFVGEGRSRRCKEEDWNELHDTGTIGFLKWE